MISQWLYNTIKQSFNSFYATKGYVLNVLPNMNDDEMQEMYNLVKQGDELRRKMLDLETRVKQRINKATPTEA